MRCNNCGAEVADGTVFCDNCGVKLNMDNNGNNYNSPPNSSRNGFNNQNYNTNAYNNMQSGYSPNMQNNYKKPNNNTAIIVIIIVTIVIIGLFAAILLFINPKKNITQVNSAVSETGIPTETATAVPVPVFNIANASSIRNTDSEGGKYSIDSVLTADKETKWSPIKSRKRGVGDWIEISASTPQYVHGIRILNGYQSKPEIWNENCRAKEVTLRFSDGSEKYLTLNDTMDMVDVNFGEYKLTSSIRLTITSVYQGTQWNDIAITYLGAY